MKKTLCFVLSVAVLSLAACTLNESVDFTGGGEKIALRSVEAQEELANLLASLENSATADSSVPADKVTLPVHDPRLYDLQPVILPFHEDVYGGSTVFCSAANRDGVDFLWVSEIAPVGMFNWTVLNRAQGEIADSEEHVWAYYYLTVKPDFYQNKVTAVEITKDEYFRIIAAYEAQ